MAEETLQGKAISQQAANLLKNGVDSEKYKGDKTGIRCHPSTHYIELAYHYDDIDKTPAAYVPYTLKFADNSTRNGTLDEKGYALEDLVPVGPVSVQYGDNSADEAQAKQLRQDFKQSLDQFIAQMEQDKKFQDAYNPSGLLTLAENPQCKVIYDYDTLGNQIEETQKTDTQSQSLTHEYDPLGNRIKTTLPSGQVVAYQYNHQQLFTQVSLDDDFISQIQRDTLGHEW